MNYFLVNFVEKFVKFFDYWVLKIVGGFNGYDIMVVKV